MQALKEHSELAQLTYDWQALVYEQHLVTDEEIAEFLELNLKNLEELNGYYKDMLQKTPEHKQFFDVEYRSRHLETHVAPEHEELEFFKRPENISRDLIMDVSRARTVDALLDYLNQYHGRSLSSLLCISLVIALSINKKDLAGDLKLYLNKIGTYTPQLKQFLADIDESLVTEIQKKYIEYVQAKQNFKQRRIAKITKRLTEASSNLTPFEKMELFNKGQRRENVKACALPKLVNYYKICLENGFKTAERLIALELLIRDKSAYVRPDPVDIDASQFTPYEAKFVLEKQDTPQDIISAATQQSFPNLTHADTLTIYLIWAIVLKLPKVIEAIKAQMKSYDTYYTLMPKLLSEISSRPNVSETIADILKNL